MDNTTLTNEVEMLENPGKWPQWPCLPLKRGEFPDGEVGVLVADQGPIVFMMNLFNAAKELKTCERKCYLHYEDITLDGWRVD